MRGYHIILGLPLPREPMNKYVCKQVDAKTTRKLIIEAGLKVISKVINTQQPEELYNMFKMPRFSQEQSSAGEE